MVLFAFRQDFPKYPKRFEKYDDIINNRDLKQVNGFTCADVKEDNHMVKVNTYQQPSGYYEQLVNKSDKKQTDKTKTEQTKDVKTLSTRAQNLLKTLREKYGNMDFMVADFDSSEDAKEILSRGTKEYSVLFSSEELEKMASDEDYLNEKLKGIDGAVRMSEEINQKFGFTSESDIENPSDTSIAKFGISFQSDGTMTLFAELEKSGVNQQERPEKRTTLQASTMEELMKKIQELDWNTIKAEDVPDAGSKFDFSV